MSVPRESVTLHPVEVAMAKARARWMVDRTKNENLGDGHGEAAGKGMRRDVPGAVAEMATAKIHGVYFDGGAENWNSADICGYQVRGTTCPRGHLPIFDNDPDDQPCLLVLLSGAPNGGALCEFAGTILAGEGKRDEWFITAKTHPHLLREGSDDQWWPPQSVLTRLVRPCVPVS